MKLNAFEEYASNLEKQVEREREIQEGFLEKGTAGVSLDGPAGFLKSRCPRFILQRVHSTIKDFPGREDHAERHHLDLECFPKACVLKAWFPTW